MHLKRQSAITKLPIPRKGTKFIARALSNLNNSVPAVVAVRDLLKLANTAQEVKKMIAQKFLKINSRIIKDSKESISLFNILEADKPYRLILLPTGKFAFEELKDKDTRLCKVIKKTLTKNNNVQLNLHDGSNAISKDSISVGDSVYLDAAGKIKKHISLEKGKNIAIISGKYIGLKGKIQSKEGNNIHILLENEKSTILNKSQIIAL